CVPSCLRRAAGRCSPCSIGQSDWLPTSDRLCLEDLVGNRNTAQNYVWRTTNVPERRANEVAECKSRVVAVQEVSQLP
ncbi:hypothetical protein JKG68_28935, partial [Microvirga aerilata]